MSLPRPPALTSSTLDSLPPPVRAYMLQLQRWADELYREADQQISAIRNQYLQPAGAMPLPQVAFASLGTTKWREGGAPAMVYVADATSGEAIAVRTGAAWKVAYLTPP